MSKIKIGVAGAGVFGNNHSNKIKGDNRAELVGIFDLDLNRAQELAAKHDTRAFGSLDEILPLVDALVVATPATAHGGVATTALTAGKHCLVEKPLAANPESAENLCRIAKEKNLILQAGHQERYIFKAMGLLEIADVPKYIEAYRIGLPSQRGADVSATFDLMIHDIDLAGLLFKSEPESIKSDCLAGPINRPDAIIAEITYKNGSRAKFMASRAADERKRTTLIEYGSGKINIDYIARTFSDTTGFGLHQDFNDRIKDPMQQATSDFISAILGEMLVQISGEDGARAVKIARMIDDACHK